VGKTVSKITFSGMYSAAKSIVIQEQ